TILGVERLFRWLILVALAASSMLARADDVSKPVPPDHAAKMQEALDLFRTQVRPALVEHCIECHSGKTPKAGLDLTTKEAVVESGMLEDSAEASFLYAT